MGPSCPYDAPVYLFPPLLGFLAFFSLGLLSFLRSRRNQTNLYFAAMCLMGGTLNLDVALVSLVETRETALLIDRIFYVLFVFSIPLYIRFTHSFLGISTRDHIQKAALLIALTLVVFVPTDFFIPALREYAYGRIAKAGPAFHAFSIFGGTAVCYCLAVLIINVRKVQDCEERYRIKYVLAGMGLSAILILMSHISVSGADLYPFGSFSFIPAIFLSVGVMKYDLIGIDAAIRKGILYFLLTLVLTFSYLLIIYLAQLFFSAPVSSASTSTSLLISLIFAIIFQPLRDRVQTATDKLFFKGKYDYHSTLKQLSRELGNLHNEQAIKDFLIETINDALHVSGVSLFTFKDDQKVCLSTSAESGFVYTDELSLNHPVARVLLEKKTYLRRSALDIFPNSVRCSILDFFCRHKASVLVPIISGDRFVGILCVGDKKSGDLFVHEDFELLMTAANQGAISLENARFYSRLEEMNRELEKRVSERTEELVRALEGKESAQQQLIQSESLAAIGQLVAGTAHELNNPLASASSLVQTSVEYLEGREDKDAGVIELIADLEFSLKEMRRARDIIKSLLGLSRQTETLMERVDVNAAIRDSLMVLHNQYKNRDLKIHTEFANIPAVVGNFGSLGQVFMNIIKNSIEAVPLEKGIINITTGYRNGAISIECSDNGPGIPQETRKDIFKPFFTTKEVGKGTGLGLYISHEIVKRHGGSIHAGDGPGGGAFIRIEFPEEMNYVGSADC